MENKNLRLFFLLTMTIFLFTGCSGKSSNELSEKPIQQEIFALGTYIELKIYDHDKEEAVESAIDLIKQYDRQISVNQKGSILDKINENAGLQPVKVPKDLMEMLIYAKKASEEIEGFDLTIGALSNLWHIGFPDARKPTQAEINQALPLVNSEYLILNADDSTAYLTQKGVLLDAGAIAKGFICDQVVSLLKKQGVTSAIINLGGNVYVIGHSPKNNNQSKWTVGIQDPNKARNSIIGYVKGSNQSFVTSGIYERFLEVDGETYHHLLNPKTGYPFDNDLQSVTIIGKSSMKDDAYSTIVYSLGAEKGLAYINQIDGYEAIFVTKSNQIILSKGLVKNFEIADNSEYNIEKTNN